MSSIKSILMQKMKGCGIYRIIPLVSDRMGQPPNLCLKCIFANTNKVFDIARFALLK